MKTLLLHVGAHKTGSTSIQKTLAHYRSELAERDIALYKGSNHSDFYRGFSDCIESFHQFYRGWRGKALQAETRDEMKRFFQENEASYYLVSAEDISLLSQQGLHDLNTFMRNECGIDHVHAVCVLREPLDYLNSSIQQFIKPGLTSLDDILQDRYDNYRLQGCPDFEGGAQNILRQLYFPIASRLVAALGSDNVSFIRFADAINNGLTKSLLNLLPTEDDWDWLDEQRFNDSISHEASLLLAEYNNRNPLLFSDGSLNKKRNRDKTIVPVIKDIPGRKANLLDASGIELDWLNTEIEKVNDLAGFEVFTSLAEIPGKYQHAPDLSFSDESLRALVERVPQTVLDDSLDGNQVTAEGLEKINLALEKAISKKRWLPWLN